MRARAIDCARRTTLVPSAPGSRSRYLRVAGRSALDGAPVIVPYHRPRRAYRDAALLRGIAWHLKLGRRGNRVRDVWGDVWGRRIPRVLEVLATKRGRASASAGARMPPGSIVAVRAG